MDHNHYRAFFLQPSTPAHKQYEALRAVFVQGLPQALVAQRFGYSYDALRQLVGQFRRQHDAGHSPPFSGA